MASRRKEGRKRTRNDQERKMSSRIRTTIRRRINNINKSGKARKSRRRQKM
jgi:hypothetical protein